MKEYQKDERLDAKKKLPKPVADFLASDTITQIYLGIIAKHKLNLRQGTIFSEAVNVTILGLESQTALETNLHQVLPELSNATLKELLEDINNRIFKEAERRLKENITEAETPWDEVEFGPKPKEGEAPTRIPSDKELDTLVEQEEKEGWKNPDEEEERAALETQEKNVPAIAEEPVPEVQGQTIVAEKLGMAVGKKIESAPVVTPPETTKGEPVKTEPPTTPKPTYNGVDPYREPAE